MVKYKSDNLKAVLSRIRRLPKLVNNAMDAQIKKDVINVIKEFQHGIRRNNFGLEQLQKLTIKRKAEQGSPKPNTPLYGEGDAEKNSLINALAIRKIRNGYRLYRRWAKHYASDLPLNVLLAIHENGAIIKDGFGKGIYIRIPPRPVVDMAIRRMLTKKKKGENIRKVRKAVNILIKTGKENELKKLVKSANKGERIEA